MPTEDLGASQELAALLARRRSLNNAKGSSNQRNDFVRRPSSAMQSSPTENFYSNEPYQENRPRGNSVTEGDKRVTLGGVTNSDPSTMITMLNLKNSALMKKNLGGGRGQPPRFLSSRKKNKDVSKSVTPTQFFGNQLPVGVLADGRLKQGSFRRALSTGVRTPSVESNQGKIYSADDFNNDYGDLNHTYQPSPPSSNFNEKTQILGFNKPQKDSWPPREDHQQTNSDQYEYSSSSKVSHNMNNGKHTTPKSSHRFNGADEPNVVSPDQPEESDVHVSSKSGFKSFKPKSSGGLFMQRVNSFNSYSNHQNKDADYVTDDEQEGGFNDDYEEDYDNYEAPVNEHEQNGEVEELNDFQQKRNKFSGGLVMQRVGSFNSYSNYPNRQTDYATDDGQEDEFSDDYDEDNYDNYETHTNEYDHVEEDQYEQNGEVEELNDFQQKKNLFSGGPVMPQVGSFNSYNTNQNRETHTSEYDHVEEDQYEQNGKVEELNDFQQKKNMFSGGPVMQQVGSFNSYNTNQNRGDKDLVIDDMEHRETEQYGKLKTNHKQEKTKFQAPKLKATGGLVMQRVSSFNSYSGYQNRDTDYETDEEQDIGTVDNFNNAQTESCRHREDNQQKLDQFDSSPVDNAQKPFTNNFSVNAMDFRKIDQKGEIKNNHNVSTKNQYEPPKPRTSGGGLVMQRVSSFNSYSGYQNRDTDYETDEEQYHENYAETQDSPRMEKMGFLESNLHNQYEEDHLSTPKSQKSGRRKKGLSMDFSPLIPTEDKSPKLVSQINPNDAKNKQSTSQKSSFNETQNILSSKLSHMFGGPKVNIKRQIVKKADHTPEIAPYGGGKAEFNNYGKDPESPSSDTSGPGVSTASKGSASAKSRGSIRNKSKMSDRSRNHLLYEAHNNSHENNNTNDQSGDYLESVPYRKVASFRSDADASNPFDFDAQHSKMSPGMQSSFVETYANGNARTVEETDFDTAGDESMDSLEEALQSEEEMSEGKIDPAFECEESSIPQNLSNSYGYGGEHNSSLMKEVVNLEQHYEKKSMSQMICDTNSLSSAFSPQEKNRDSSPRSLRRGTKNVDISQNSETPLLGIQRPSYAMGEIKNLSQSQSYSHDEEIDIISQEEEEKTLKSVLTQDQPFDEPSRMVQAPSMETPISYNPTNSFKTISPPPVVSESSHHQTPTRLVRPVPGRKHLPPSQNIIRAPSMNSTDRPVQIGSRNSSFSSPADFRLHSRNNTTSPKYLQLQQENQKLLQEISSLKAKLLEKDRLIDDLTKKLEKKQEPKTSQSMQKAPSTSSSFSSVAKQHNRSQTPPQPRTPPMAETKIAKQQQESITKESSVQRSPKRLLSSRTLQQRKALSAKAIHITPSKSAPQKTKEEPKKHSPVNTKKKTDLSPYLAASSRRLASSPTAAVSASVSASTSTTKTSTSTPTTNNNKKNQTEDTSISAMLKKKRSKMQLRRSRTPIDGKVEEAVTTGNTTTTNNNNNTNKKTERMQPSQTRSDYDGSLNPLTLNPLTLNPLTPKASGNSNRRRLHKAESVNKVAEKNANTDKNVPKNNTVVTQNITLDIKKPHAGRGATKNGNQRRFLC